MSASNHVTREGRSARIESNSFDTTVYVRTCVQSIGPKQLRTNACMHILVRLFNWGTPTPQTKAVVINAFANNTRQQVYFSLKKPPATELTNTVYMVHATGTVGGLSGVCRCSSVYIHVTRVSDIAGSVSAFQLIGTCFMFNVLCHARPRP